MPRSATFPTLAQGLVLAALLTGAGWFATMQVQPWLASATSLRLGWAAALVAIYTGWIAAAAWCRRRARHVASPGDLTVWYASQTGSAERLAQRTAQLLQHAGVAACARSVQELQREDLSNASRALFVVSTTGEGDAPDAAARILRELLAQNAALTPLRYGVLALGDRDYANFCAFGHRLDAWLRRSGAQPLFDLVEVDDHDEGALRHWQHHVAQIGGATELPDWSPPAYSSWTLRSRRHLNPGSAGGAVFHVELVPHDGADLDWRAGDIAEIGPRHGAVAIADFLATLGLQADTPSRERLAALHWPEATAVRGQPLSAWIDTLSPLPHREYSIASVPADGALWLLVRQLRRPDGTLGLGAGWLTEHAPLGERIDLRLRANAGFRLPEDARPLILIGNGSGMAGLRALLRECIARGRRRNWLLFGERNAAVDAFHGEEIMAWLRAGLMARVDWAWSRDGAQRVYVQDRVREAGSQLRQWVEAGASIYVCGSLAGMAPGVDAALRDVLGTATVDALMDAGRYRRDVY